MSDVKKNIELTRWVPMGKYRHKKGMEYEVIGYAKHSETLEDMIIYKALYGEGLTWVRPAGMFLDEGRFTYLGEEKVESRCGLHCTTCETRWRGSKTSRSGTSCRVSKRWASLFTVNVLWLCAVRVRGLSTAENVSLFRAICSISIPATPNKATPRAAPE